MFRKVIIRRSYLKRDLFSLRRISLKAGYRELEVYKLSRELSNEILAISKNFPKEERYSLTDQVRRSSRSVGAQIAEAWAKRRYEKHFISKLTDADGEQYETQHWLETAFDCDYIERDILENLLKSTNL
ncbi:MAG: four helix bundle protein [Ignavibacteria bacterium]